MVNHLLPPPTPYNSPLTLRRLVYGFGIGSIVIASVLPFGYRVAFTVFGAVFLVAADAIKDTEKTKAKARAETIIELKTEMLEGYEKSLDGRYTNMTEHIGNAFANAMNRIAFTIKDASPTRSANLRITPAGDDEHTE